MKSFNEIMRKARNLSQTMSPGDEPIILGATKGQILHQPHGQLTVESCWLAIVIAYNYDKDLGEIRFRPLIALDQPCADVAPNSTLVNLLTGKLCHFGGVSIQFHHNYIPDLSPDDPGLMYTITHAPHATQAPAAQQEIIEVRRGELAVHNNDYFCLGRPNNRYTDERRNLVKFYNGTKNFRWRRLTAGPQEEYEVSHTEKFTQLVPTIWLSPQGPKVFLDFVAKWQTSEKGDLVRARIRPFQISHTVNDRGCLITRTIIHEAQSMLS